MKRETALVEALLDLSRPLVGIGVRSVQAAGQGVTVPQYRVLVLLEDNGALSVGMIALELGVNPSNASRVCDRLARLGLITRTASERDRRTVLVDVTKAGRDVVRGVMAHRRQEMTRVVQHLESPSADGLVHALGEVAAAARAVEADDLAAGARGPGPGRSASS